MQPCGSRSWKPTSTPPSPQALASQPPPPGSLPEVTRRSPRCLQGDHGLFCEVHAAPCVVLPLLLRGRSASRPYAVPCGFQGAGRTRHEQVPPARTGQGVQGRGSPSPPALRAAPAHRASLLVLARTLPSGQVRRGLHLPPRAWRLALGPRSLRPAALGGVWSSTGSRCLDETESGCTPCPAGPAASSFLPPPGAAGTCPRALCKELTHSRISRRPSAAGVRPTWCEGQAPPGGGPCHPAWPESLPPPRPPAGPGSVRVPGESCVPGITDNAIKGRRGCTLAGERNEAVRQGLAAGRD